MILFFFSSSGCGSWDLERRPLIPERMPVLIDDDLRFEDGPAAPRVTTVVNRWLRELPISGAAAPLSWASYAQVLKAWMEFLVEHQVGLFASRDELKAALSRYAQHRATGPDAQRFAASTWGRHMSVLSVFYRWAIREGHAEAEPFTYRTARALFAGTGREVRANLAVRRTPKPHVTLRYLEADFVRLLVQGLAGLAPDGQPDTQFKGRELARNAAVAELVLASGLRLAEFSFLLVYELPAPPSRPSAMPIALPVPAGIAKGSKPRTTWVSYEALAGIHQYVGLDRAAATEGSGWLPSPRGGGPLLVSEPDARGGRINGVRRAWEHLTPDERVRLVAPDGGSCVLAVKAGGGPFTGWEEVFARTSQRIRLRFEPRFPHVHPHRLRHSFAMRTLEALVAGHYRQVARLVVDTDGDAALGLYLLKADPLMVLRDLLGHASVLTTEKYLRRLDTTRIFRQAYEHAGVQAGLLEPDISMETDAGWEADAEFDDEGGR